MNTLQAKYTRYLAYRASIQLSRSIYAECVTAKILEGRLGEIAAGNDTEELVIFVLAFEPLMSMDAFRDNSIAMLGDLPTRPSL